MNTISQDRSTGAATRISRAIGAAAVSAVLIAGLAGCMTGRVAATTENVKQGAPVPAGIDTRLPADRIVERLERAARPPAQTNPYPGRTADHLDRLLSTAR